ncbi:MAG: methionine aminotransferase [Halieaceae bacterium]|jgi:methionine aminotransferase
MDAKTPAIDSKLPDVGTTIFSVMSQLAADHSALNLSQGFPDFDGPEELLDRVGWHIKRGSNQYAPMPGLLVLREQIAEKVSRLYNCSACPEQEITVLPGATEAIYCAITACVNPGDEVIVFDPCYDSYVPAISLSRGIVRHLTLSAPEFAVDWSAVEAAINPRTRMIIINSPHNPTGATLQQRDLDQLAKLVRETNIIVLSDEVYEHLVYDGHKHASVLQHPELNTRSFAVFSFGKTYHVTGWKTGYCIAPPALTSELRKVHQFVTFVAVTPIQLALADFMASNGGYVDQLPNFYQHKRDLFCRGLAGSRFKLKPSAGTYFQLLDYSAISELDDQTLARELTVQKGVAAIPISVFSEQPENTRYLRLCFAKNDDTLKEATEILCKI